MLATAPALVYFADLASTRRLDILPDEQLDITSFGLEDCIVQKDVSLEFRARQLLNQVRELYHVH